VVGKYETYSFLAGLSNRTCQVLSHLRNFFGKFSTDSLNTTDYVK